MGVPNISNEQGMRIAIAGKTDDQLTPEQKKWADEQRKKGIDPWTGEPIRPEFQSELNQDTGYLDEKYMLANQFDPIELNTQGLDKFREEALRDGPSKWAGLQEERLNQQNEYAMDNIMRSQRGQTNQAIADLASSGGVSGASRERLAQQAMKNAMFQRQEQRQNLGDQMLNVQIQDEQNRVNQLGQLPGMEVQALQPQFQNREFEAKAREFDINNALSERDAKRAFEMDRYKEYMKDKAAKRQAEATRNSGSSCFIPSTPIEMEDGSYKAIKDITLGDRVAEGGKVKAVVEGLLEGILFDYKGILVTGAHLVLEDGRWTRVDRSRDAIRTNKTTDKVYNLITEDHIIIAENIVFSDFEEIDNHILSDRVCKIMNQGMRSVS